MKLWPLFLLALSSRSVAGISGAPRRNEFHIEDFGAVGDGVTLNTQAFKDAVDAIKEAGDGFLHVPAGQWVTAPFNFTSHMTLFLESEAVILGATDMSLYQIIAPLPSYGQGRDHIGPRFEPLIGGKDEEDMVITGNNGTIDGQGQVWWDFHNSGEEVFTRGSLIEFMSSKDIVVEQVTLMNSPFWTVHPFDCENLLFREVTILSPHDAPNTDGIDPDSCVNVIIEDSFFSNGDDGVAIKSGWDCFGVDFNKPTRNVYIRNLTVITMGHGGVSIGSEMSGGVENVFITDSHFIGSGLRIKTNPTRGAFIRNVFYSNIKIEDAAKNFGIEIATDYGDPNPSCPSVVDAPVDMKNFVYNNISGENINKALRFFGMENDIIHGLFLNDVSISVVDPSPSNDYECQFVEGSFNDLFPNPLGECDELINEVSDSAAAASMGGTVNAVLIGLMIGIAVMAALMGIWYFSSKRRTKAPAATAIDITNDDVNFVELQA